MTLLRFETAPLGANAWVLSDSGEVLVIDPGGEDRALSDASLGEGLDGCLVGVFLTHGHIDHIAGLAPFVTRGVPVYIGEGDAAALLDPRVNLAAWLGMPFTPFACAPSLVRDGDEIRVGSLSFRVISAPGHSPGSICLYGAGHIFTGDVLFASGVGRTDLPGGNPAELARSIRDKLFSLPDATIVHPGHGGDTTIGGEKQNFFY